MPQAGATTSANAALTAAAMASARHRRRGSLPAKAPAWWSFQTSEVPDDTRCTGSHLVSRSQSCIGDSTAATALGPRCLRAFKCGILRRLITIPEWLATPSKYQRYWVRYTVASVAGLWTLRFLYMCGGPFPHLISSMRTVLHVTQACLLNLHSAFMCWSELSTVSYSPSARPVRYFPYVINKGAAKFRCMPPCSE